MTDNVRIQGFSGVNPRAERADKVCATNAGEGVQWELA